MVRWAFYSTSLQLNTKLIGHRPVLVTIWAVEQAGKTFGGFPRLDEIDTYRRVAYRIHPARPCVGYHPPRTSSSYHTRTVQSLSMTKTATTVYLPHNPQPLPRCHPCARHLTLRFLPLGAVLASRRVESIGQHLRHNPPVAPCKCGRCLRRRRERRQGQDIQKSSKPLESVKAKCRRCVPWSTDQVEK
jgi:hypothetical protein